LALLFGHSLVNCRAFSALNFNSLACFKGWGKLHQIAAPNTFVKAAKQEHCDVFTRKINVGVYSHS
jgi:hypothetical protein